jgi:hypothetical protein
MVTAGRRYYAPLADLDRQRAHRNFDEHLWLPIVIARHSVGASNWSPTDDRRDLPLAVDGGRDWVSARPETAVSGGTTKPRGALCLIYAATFSRGLPVRARAR